MNVTPAQAQRRYREKLKNGHEPRLTNEWCVRGHHKPTTGTAGRSNGCLVCVREKQRDYRRRVRSEKYGAPVELFGVRSEGLNLRPLRESLGLTRPRLEALSGVSRFTIVDIERGKSKGNPTSRAKLINTLAPLLAEREERKRRAAA